MGLLDFFFGERTITVSNSILPTAAKQEIYVSLIGIIEKTARK